MTKSYCVREKKQTDSDNERYERTKNGRLMLKSTCVSCGGKKSKFMSSTQKKGEGMADYIFPALIDIGRAGVAKAVKSDFAKKKMKSIANKYLDQALDSVTSDLSQKIAPNGGGFDVHKAIGKIPKPRAGWTPGKYKYMGPYNPLDQQLQYDPNTGKVINWYVEPYNKVDEISAYHDICYRYG